MRELLIDRLKASEWLSDYYTGTLTEYLKHLQALSDKDLLKLYTNIVREKSFNDSRY